MTNTVKEIPANIEFDGATLLSQEEAQESLNPSERRYQYCWWLRSPSKIMNDEALYVYSSHGYVCDGELILSREVSVRPALIIRNLEDTDLEIGDCFLLCKIKFKVISNNLAFMIDNEIGKCYFDDESNAYENSYVKSVVDNWYNFIIKKTKND